MITLATLAEATPKQIIDQVKTHLLAQNAQAKNKSGGCDYRLAIEDGRMLKCAIGCLMSDEEHKVLENKKLVSFGWSTLVEESNGAVPSAHKDLLIELQLIHDLNPPEVWPNAIEYLEENLFPKN